MDKTTRIICFFDIASSSRIIEDLKVSDSSDKWADVIVELEGFLKRNSNYHKYEIYKFLGDGWILLFDNDCVGESLLTFLKELDEYYRLLHKNNIKPLLSATISTVGLTFGLDKGELLIIPLGGGREFVGRSLNVAARLQSAIKDKDEYPVGKALFSPNAFIHLFQDKNPGSYRTLSVTRSLRNIGNNQEFKCKKIILIPEVHKMQKKTFKTKLVLRRKLVSTS